jgi:hypothetical protein
VFFSGALFAGYVLLWTALATPVLRWFSSAEPEQRLDWVTSLGLAGTLAGFRLLSGLCVAWLLTSSWFAFSQNDPLIWLPYATLPIEAVVLAALTAVALFSLGAPARRAFAGGLLLELASLVFAVVGAPVHLVLHGWLYGIQVFAGPALPDHIAVDQWTGRCAIDEHGSMWVGARQPVAGVFYELVDCCGRRDDGTVWCDGREVDAAVVQSDRHWMVVDAGRATTLDPHGIGTGPWQAFTGICGVSTQGALTCSDDPDHVPPPAGLPKTGWKDVATGYEVACGLRTDGRPVCWGRVDCWSPAPDVAFDTLRVSRIEACGRAGDRWTCWGHPDRPALPDDVRDVRPGSIERLWVGVDGQRHTDVLRTLASCSASP